MGILASFKYGTINCLPRAPLVGKQTGFNNCTTLSNSCFPDGKFNRRSE